jgi:hypothetical protein
LPRTVFVEAVRSTSLEVCDLLHAFLAEPLRVATESLRGRILKGLPVAAVSRVVLRLLPRLIAAESVG